MIPVVLSGGSGTRLWPISRTKHPKQFAEIFGEGLLARTLKRLRPLGMPWTITTSELKVLTDRVYRDLNLQTNVIYEPYGRNTAPAIAVLCHVLSQKGFGSSVAGVFPADHFIEKESDYLNILKLAEALAQQGSIVTIGIKPDHPATGYGYIEIESDVLSEQGSHKAFRAIGFREKPSESKAKEFISTGRFNWNAGMFVFKVSTMIDLFKKHQSPLWEKVTQLKDNMSNLKDIYDSIEGISIDYAIMEKLSSHVCIPCEIGWSDVGSWDEVAKIKEDNTRKIEINASKNFVLTQDKKSYAFIDVSDLVVIDTNDAVLIAKAGSSQKVKDVVEVLKKSTAANDKTLLNERNFEYRPWGRYEILRDTEMFKSKIIHVEPGQQLSYQSHAKRAEHWVITKGCPEVVLNDVVHSLKAGESIYIPQGAKHRMKNPTQEVVEFVEVQVGTYFGEDDIVRYQDDYNRT